MIEVFQDSDSRAFDQVLGPSKHRLVPLHRPHAHEASPALGAVLPAFRPFLLQPTIWAPSSPYLFSHQVLLVLSPRYLANMPISPSPSPDFSSLQLPPSTPPRPALCSPTLLTAEVPSCPHGPAWGGFSLLLVEAPEPEHGPPDLTHSVPAPSPASVAHASFSLALGGLVTWPSPRCPSNRTPPLLAFPRAAPLAYVFPPVFTCLTRRCHRVLTYEDFPASQTRAIPWLPTHPALSLPVGIIHYTCPVYFLSVRVWVLPCLVPRVPAPS